MQRRPEEVAAEMAKAAATVVLAVNGKRYEAAGVAPSTSLLEFLRTQTPVRGPKLGCGEGTSTLYERAIDHQVDTFT